jgi:hypothetical protein
MAASSRYSLPTQPKSREKRACLYNNQFQNRRHKQLTKVRTLGVSALERSVAKQIATGGFKPGSRVRQPHTCLDRTYMYGSTLFVYSKLKIAKHFENSILTAILSCLKQLNNPICIVFNKLAM